MALNQSFGAKDPFHTPKDIIAKNQIVIKENKTFCWHFVILCHHLKTVCFHDYFVKQVIELIAEGNWYLLSTSLRPRHIQTRRCVKKPCLPFLGFESKLLTTGCHPGKLKTVLVFQDYFITQVIELIAEDNRYLLSTSST